MSLRRGLALVLMVAAPATLMASATAARAEPLPQNAGASSSTTICVALVVDASSLGSDVSVGCAKVHQGATGIDVLEAEGHTVAFRHDGLLCTIDGLPKTGCADVNDTHYWAYYHRAPGGTSWAYSDEGGSSYEPVNASTDGWVYENGTSKTPENVPYASICKPVTKTASPTPTSSATASAKSSPKPLPKTSAKASAPLSASAVPGTDTSATSVPTSVPTKSASPKATSAKATSATQTGSPAASRTPLPAPTSTFSSGLLTGSSTPTSPSHGVRNLALGLIVVAAMAALAVTAWLRRRPSP